MLLLYSLRYQWAKSMFAFECSISNYENVNLGYQLPPQLCNPLRNITMCTHITARGVRTLMNHEILISFDKVG